MCNNGVLGSVDITPTGGTGPYNISWAGPVNGSPLGNEVNTSGNSYNITGLATGSYTVTITDANGCNFVLNPIVITAPTAIVSTVTPSAVLCYGGTSGNAFVTASGGTSPYNVSWTGPVSGSPSGNEINASGGNYTITGLSSGTYSVTVTDANGCFQTINGVVITQPQAALAIATSNIINNLCYGASAGSVTITATHGTAPYQIAWSGPVSGNPSGNEVVSSGGNFIIPSLPSGSYTATLTDDNGCIISTPFVIGQPALISISNNLTPVLCHGGNTGTATFTVSGATPPYNIAWNGPVSGAPAGNEIQVSTGSYVIQGLLFGNYAVTITDANGCDTTLSISITEPQAPLVFTQTNIVNNPCFGGNIGSVVIAASNGTAPYNVSWTGPVNGNPVGNEILNSGGNYTVNNLLAGNYTLTVTDANSCTTTGPLSITEPPTSVNIAQSNIVNVLCFGQSNGAVTITGTNGTAPYNVSWTGPVNGSPAGNEILSSGNSYTVNGLAAGNYTVTLTDNHGCAVNTSVSITQPSAFTINSSTTIVSCFGGNNGTATLAVGGATAPYNISWSGPVNGSPNGNEISTSGGSYSIMNLSSGSYTITISDGNGCSTTTPVTINQPTAISVLSTAQNNLCFNDATGAFTFNVTGGTPGYNISWSGQLSGNPIGFEILASGGSYILNNLSAGQYNITVSDANLCSTNFVVDLIPPAPVVLSTQSIIDNLCYNESNGQITLLGSGGVAPYQVSWNGPVSGNPVGTEIASSGMPYTISSLLSGLYSVQLMDFNGCSQTVQVAINDPGAISLNAISNSVLCNGGSTGNITVNAIGGASGYNISWSGPINGNPIGNEIANSGGTYQIVNLPFGNYSLLLTDANGCVSSISAQVLQPDAISTTATIVDVLCHGATTGAIDVTILGGTPFVNGAPYIYQWDNGTTTEDLNNIGVGTYVLTVTDANNCSQSFTFYVTEPAALSVAMNATNVHCHGYGNGSSLPSVSGGVGPYTYLWTATNGGILTTGPTSSNQINLVPGTYTVLITDANGCTLTDIAIITQPAQLTMSEVHTHINCFGGSTGSIDVTVNGGTQPYSYSWSSIPGGLPIYTTEDLFFIPAGGYYLTITDANNCTISQQVILTQPGSPISTILTVQDVLCHGNSSGSLTVNITGGTPFTQAPHYIIEYFSGGNLIASGVTTVSGLPAGVYQVKVTDALGCYQILQDTIFEPLAPLDYSWIPTNIICQGMNTGSIFVTVTGGTQPYSYSWVVNGMAGVYATEDITGLDTGTYQLLITDANQCTLNTFTTTLTSPDSIQLNESVVDVTCFGFQNGQISTYATGGTAPYTYAWSSFAGPIPAGQSNLANIGSTTPQNGLFAGIYTLNLTDNNGCPRQFNILVNQPSAPLSVAIDSSVSVACKGSCSGRIYFTPSGGTPYYLVKLYNTSTGLFVNTQAISTISFNNPNSVFFFDNVCPGNYAIFIEDSNACTMNTTVTVTITEPNTVMNSTMFVVSNGGCNNTSGQIQVDVAGGNAPYNVAWTNLITGVNTSPISFEILSDPGSYVAAGLGAGIYQVFVTDGNGCTQMEELSVDSTTSLLAAFLAIDTAGCAPFGVTFSNLSYGINVSYLWDFGNGQTSTEFEPTAYFSAGGPYDITLTITDAAGCSQTITNDNYILSYSGPTASFYPETGTIDYYSGAIQFYNSSQNAISYVWDFGDGSPVSYATDPAHAYESMLAGSYVIHLQAIDINGCIDDTTMIIGAIEPLQMFVPNSFTLDGNGLNDDFKPTFTLPDLISKYSFQIYNRWGQLIFETNNQYDAWDGTYKGEKVQFGTYIWKIKYSDAKGNPVDGVGHVNVIR